MKRIIKFVIAIGFILFIFQFAVMFFINKHEIQYILSQGSNTYTVKENFEKIKKKHYYYFEVLDKSKNKFVFYYNEDYKKKKKVLEQVEIYKENDVYCMAPIFKNHRLGGIVCRRNNELVSYDYLRREGLVISSFEENLQKKGYTLDYNDVVSKNDKITVYQHFPKNYSLALWNYRGLHIVTQDHIKSLDILDDDHYENTLGILVGKYYVVADTDQNFEYDRLYIVDVLNESKDFVDLDVHISKDSYFMGVVGDDIYILDRDQKKQYTFNIKTRKLNEIGNKDANASVYSQGKFQEENIYTVSSSKKMFDMNLKVDELEKLYHPKFIRESIHKYYFVTEDGKVYYTMKDDLKTKVLLFQDFSLEEFKLVEDDLFFVSGDHIVMYNFNSGYHKIVTHSELLYNHKNIFDVLQK